MSEGKQNFLNNFIDNLKKVIILLSAKLNYFSHLLKIVIKTASNSDITKEY